MPTTASMLVIALLTIGCTSGRRHYAVELVPRAWDSASVALEQRATKGQRCTTLPADSLSGWSQHVVDEDSTWVANLPPDLLRAPPPPQFPDAHLWRASDGAFLILRRDPVHGVQLLVKSRYFGTFYGVESCLLPWTTDPIVALGLVAHFREDSTGYGSITDIAAYTAEIYLPLPNGPIYSVVLYAPTLQRRGELLAGIASIRHVQ